MFKYFFIKLCFAILANIFLLGISLSINNEVYKEIAYNASILLVVAFWAIFGGWLECHFNFFIDISSFEVKFRRILKICMVCVFFISAFFAYCRWGELMSAANYTEIRELKIFFIPEGVLGYVYRTLTYIMLIIAGLMLSVLGGDKYKNSHFLTSDLILIAAAVLLPIILQGSRSLAIVFICSYLSAVSNVNPTDLFKKLIFVLLGTIIISYLRGVSFDKLLIPFDSFLVGPHLFHQKIGLINSQIDELKAYYILWPGYASFSGLYTFFKLFSNALGFGIFPHSFEDVFWARGEFIYIPAFESSYNSYYSAGLAILIEGWRSYLVVFCVFAAPYFVVGRCSILMLRAIVLVYLAFLMEYSIFQDPCMAIIFFGIVVFDFFKYRILNKFYIRP
jgi:hypothetical protein